MAEAFTLRVFVPDGDPEGVRIVDRMNWTGRGFVVPRDRWAEVKTRPELSRPGVYVLIGYEPDELGNDRPVAYIGQTPTTYAHVSRAMTSSAIFGNVRSCSYPPTVAGRATRSFSKYTNSGLYKNKFIMLNVWF